MAPFRALLAALLAAPAAGVTPMEKVIQLIEGMKSEVEAEGTSEAAAYDEFACFCEKTTATKAESILGGKTSIDDLSTTIAEETAQLKVSSSDLLDRKGHEESLKKDEADMEAECSKAKVDYNSEAASTSKALTSIKNAISSLEASKPAAAVLLELRESAKTAPAVAAAVSMMEQHAKSLRRVDPASPQYTFFSQPIIDTLTQLETEFSGKKTELDTEWAKTKENCEVSLEDFGTRIEANSKSIGELDGTVEGLKTSISEAREQLVLAEGTLKDDKLYLKDLTERCEKRAVDWDQRSKMRGDELTALTEVLGILEGNVSAIDTEVNKRVLLQRGWAEAPVAPASKRQVREVPSFFQSPSASSKAVVVTPHDKAQQQQKARALKAAELLSGVGHEFRSVALVALSFDLKADPFAKVKDMIQGLIERLLTEGNNEAKKDSYCKEGLAKAEKERGYRFADAKKLNVMIAELESKKEELTNENLVLSDDIENLQDTLNKSTELREKDHEVNMDTIAKAKEGLQAITQAIVVMKTFYKQAAKASSFLQAAASPVDEATQGPGFSGSYKGKQDGAKGVMGMLEVIKTDFQRTLTQTKAAEEEAAASFVESERTAEADSAGKEMKMQLNAEDLEATKNKLEQSMADLKTAMDLTDAEVKKLEDLHPMCVDNGMTYEERVEKREAEIKALTRAMCILDTNLVEEKCTR